MTEYELVAQGEVTEEAHKVPTTSQLVLRRLVDGPCGAETLAAHAGVSYSRISRVLGELIPKGAVVMTGKVGNRKQYALADIGPEVALSTS
ncbi:MAG: hypothetical protein M3R13_02575 [Armatimonadota bacterium]|nr:hypothetical protein [Armatimonadota bacterium]